MGGYIWPLNRCQDGLQRDMLVCTWNSQSAYSLHFSTLKYKWQLTVDWLSLAKCWVFVLNQVHKCPSEHLEQPHHPPDLVKVTNWDILNHRRWSPHTLPHGKAPPTDGCKPHLSITFLQTPFKQTVRLFMDGPRVKRRVDSCLSAAACHCNQNTKPVYLTRADTCTLNPITPTSVRDISKQSQ